MAVSSLHDLMILPCDSVCVHLDWKCFRGLTKCFFNINKLIKTTGCFFMSQIWGFIYRKYEERFSNPQILFYENICAKMSCSTFIKGRSYYDCMNSWISSCEWVSAITCCFLNQMLNYECSYDCQNSQIWSCGQVSGLTSCYLHQGYNYGNNDCQNSRISSCGRVSASAAACVPPCRTWRCPRSPSGPWSPASACPPSSGAHPWAASVGPPLQYVGQTGWIIIRIVMVYMSLCKSNTVKLSHFEGKKIMVGWWWTCSWTLSGFSSYTHNY